MLMDFISVFLVIAVCGVAFWFYGSRNYNYWVERNVFSVKPVLPYLGNIRIGALFGSNLQLINSLYKSLSGQPYGGLYFFTRPVIMVRDPELIKKILVTDFNHFVSRGFHSNPGRDPLSKNLIHANGADWKYLRPKMQMAFNYNKLKCMVADMDALAQDIVEQIRSGNVKRLASDTFEAANVSDRYMIDVVCRIVFGVKSEAIESNSKSVFYTTGKDIFNGYHFLIHVFVGYLFPWLHKLLRLSLARDNVTEFFTSISRKAVQLRSDINGANKHREENKKNNFLDILIDMTQEGKWETRAIQSEQAAANKQTANANFVCDEDFVAANVFMFFAAGYESSAKICTFCLFELAANEPLQTRAKQEIRDVLQEYDNKLSMEALQKMTYLEQILQETNRKYPILSMVFRKCIKRYTMPDGGVIDPGTPVLIPSSAIHFDSEYFPDSDKFDPDRFSEDNKRHIHPSTHLPFGMGPRICIAWQFAMVEMKVFLARILSEYEISLHPSNNKYPLKLLPKAFLLTPQSDIYINFKRSTS